MVLYIGNWGETTPYLEELLLMEEIQLTSWYGSLSHLSKQCF